ncbi:MAG: AI-2 transport protein TqsA [Maribacter sp.]|jgi:AI-2 transport protein TqsA
MKNTAYSFIVAISVIWLLIQGQSLIVPFVMGVLIWFIFRRLKAGLDRIPFIKNNFPAWSKGVLPFLMVLLLIIIIFEILSVNIQNLTLSYAKYEHNVAMVVEKINEAFNTNIELSSFIAEKMENFDFGQLLGSVLSSISDIMSNAFMIILYSLFVLLEESNFTPKIKVLSSNPEQFEKNRRIMEKIEVSISNYFGLKSFLSLITGVLSYIVLLIIGVDAPAFWAFLIFILNFIPTIGSLIGTMFPAVFSLLQFGEFTPFILILVFVGIIQLIVGNILEPRLMGSSMNISPLVTIIALSLWGFIWGITGMVLSVPITVVIIIICSQFEKTKPVAILLSEKGEI